MDRYNIGLLLKRALRVGTSCVIAVGVLNVGGASTAFAGAVAAYDLVVLNGRVIDPESNLDAIRNIGIIDGKVVEIGSAAINGRIILDARGLVVAPGFIDLHQHNIDSATQAVKAADGVTTALELEVGVGDLDAWYTSRSGSALINYGASIGHIPVRMAVLRDPSNTLMPSGDAVRRAATSSELDQITSGLEKGLRRGAVAVGLGPAYTPAATNAEILRVFEIAARFAASIHVHIRGALPAIEGDLEGFQEVLANAAATGASLHVVHIQSTGGRNVVEELNMVRGARTRGLDITAEVYPYDRGQTEIRSALFDSKENEPDSYYASLLRPETGEALTRESFLRYRNAGGMVILPNTTPDMLRAAIADPLTMIASDGILIEGRGHPRTAGTYARVLGQYVREERVMSLMDALRKMTLMPAQRLERRVPAMRNKGRLRIGADADITVFDPANVRDAATYTEPSLPSVGIRHVLVAGVPVVRDGRLQTGIAPGNPVRAPLE